MMASVLVIGSVVLLSTPRSIVAESPTQPQTLPPPFLSDANAADAPYGSTPAIDGRINPGEYAGAHRLTFPTYGGDMEVFIRQNAITLYIALDSPDTTPFPFNSGGGLGPAFQVFLDTKHNGGTLPLPDDYRLTVRKDGSLAEDRGSGAGWNPMINISWTAMVYTATYGWQAEYAIDLTKAWHHADRLDVDRVGAGRSVDTSLAARLVLAVERVLSRSIDVGQSRIVERLVDVLLEARPV